MGSQIEDSDSSFGDQTYYSEEKSQKSKSSMEKISEQEEETPKNPKIMLNFKTLKKISTMMGEGQVPN